MLLAKIKKIVPREFREIAMKFYYYVVDIFEILFGLKDTRYPPRSKTIFVGRGDFKKIGERFLKYFVDLCDLKPYHTVLDIGCGIGRIAIPLTNYLDKRGRYEGFDIVKEGIEWCKKNISSKYPNFHFQWADVFNKEYNPKGKFKASNYKFPYLDDTFDVVFLTSVFTHMLAEDLENYFSEIVRVLKKGGKSLITYFLLNDESRSLLNSGRSKVDFKYDYGKFRVMDNKTPELAVAYEESFVLNLYDKHGFKIEGIYYGSWCGRKDFLNYQDIIIATKL